MTSLSDPRLKIIPTRAGAHHRALPIGAIQRVSGPPTFAAALPSRLPTHIRALRRVAQAANGNLDHSPRGGATRQRLPGRPSRRQTALAVVQSAGGRQRTKRGRLCRTQSLRIRSVAGLGGLQTVALRRRLEVGACNQPMAAQGAGRAGGECLPLVQPLWRHTRKRSPISLKWGRRFACSAQHSTMRA